MNPAPAYPTAADPLAQLRDIHLPEEIPWWPPAPGWWLLALLLLIALAAITIGLIRHRQATAYRRAALRELDQLVTADRPPCAALQGINCLLKRTALVAYPNNRIASLHGGQWAGFLRASAPAANDPEIERLLAERVYSPSNNEPIDVNRLAQFSRQWIKKHQRPEKLNCGDWAC